MKVISKLAGFAMLRVTAVCLGVSLLLSAGQAEFEKARSLYERTQYREALAQLVPLVTDTSLPAGMVYESIGRNYFMLGDFKKAAEAFEKAVAADQQKSAYRHWLGKAYGRRAETANPLSAPGLASKARTQFEKAVELDPKNIEAINDLFSYYLEAPGFLGGGLDKAAALSRKINAIDPIEYHYALAKIAESRNDWNSAEQHFRRAVELAPRHVGRVIDLAKFLAKRGRHSETEAAFAKAEQIAPDEPKVLFEKASYYIQTKRNLDTAKLLLQKYLKSTLGPDDPPREEAQKLLRQAGA